MFWTEYRLIFVANIEQAYHSDKRMVTGSKSILEISSIIQLTQYGHKPYY